MHNSYREQEESRNYVDELTKKYHERTGNYPSKEQAIQLIRLYKRTWLTKPKYNWNKRYFEFHCHAIFLADELVRRIRKSGDEDPIRTIYAFRNFMDDIITDSNSCETSNFASALRDVMTDILEKSFDYMDGISKVIY